MGVFVSFEQTFNSIYDRLRLDEGMQSELDYVEQTSWILFLKYLADLEREREMEAQLTDHSYSHIIKPEFRWSTWAVPQNEDGTVNIKDSLKGDDLIDFVKDKLFPYLQGFKQRASSSDTIEYKIGEIFQELKLRCESGFILREVIEHVHSLTFGSETQKHELSTLYEERIKSMGNSGRNGGEYYTPRPLIRAMIQVIDPQIGETIYDPAVGSAGFLCEAYKYMRQGKLSTDDLNTLEASTFYGKEKKSLAYVMGVMNMILHGIDSPNIIRTNTLSEDITGISEDSQHDIILANPPFGGKERKEVQQNFIIKSSETAFLFLQHFIKSLKAGGRAAIVIKNTFLSNSDNAAISLRKELLETCDLHTILDCPSGTFQGAGVKTVVLFFQKGTPTKKTWFYQLDPGRNLGKTNPLNDTDMEDFLKLQPKATESEQSWTINIKDLDPDTYDLSPKNPNAPEEEPLRSPQDILEEIAELDSQSETLLATIKELLKKNYKELLK